MMFDLLPQLPIRGWEEILFNEAKQAKLQFNKRGNEYHMHRNLDKEAKIALIQRQMDELMSKETNEFNSIDCIMIIAQISDTTTKD